MQTFIQQQCYSRHRVLVKMPTKAHQKHQLGATGVAKFGQFQMHIMSASPSGGWFVDYFQIVNSNEFLADIIRARW